MSENTNGQHPETVDRPKLSKIWILPIVALLIGIGMVYDHWQNLGVKVQLTFETAEGLVTGKTKLKNRDVEIGLVTGIRFSDDRTHIIVDLEVEKSMKGFLQNDSQFWVVRPRVGTSGISGIGTLLTGAFIQISSGQSGVFEDSFVGLELPPATPLDAEGIQLTLVSEGGKPLQIGNPVIYRGFRVGQVESYRFDSESRTARYRIFVLAPYHELVTNNTLFWNVGGLSVSTSAKGIKVDVATLDSLIAGGVQFDVPEGISRGEPVKQSRNFQLYDSKESFFERKKYAFLEYVILVEDSIGGLNKGAPVEFRGIRIGTVSNHMSFDQVTKLTHFEDEDRIPVIIRIEPRRVSDNEFLTLEMFGKIFDDWVKGGLTASLETGNLLTGNSKIILTPKGPPIEKLDKFGEYAVIPSKPGGFANISKQVENILAKLEKLPLEKTMSKVNAVIDSTDNTLVALQETLNELQETLDGVQPNSSIYRTLETTMSKLQITLDGTKPLMQEVNNKPNSLIFGNAKGIDVVPKSPLNRGK